MRMKRPPVTNVWAPKVTLGTFGLNASNPRTTRRSNPRETYSNCVLRPDSPSFSPCLGCIMIVDEGNSDVFETKERT